MQDDKASFTAADAFPVKLLQNSKLVKSIVEDRIIPPLHVQFIPTNKCNLKCSFCSCSEEDRTKEMTLTQMRETIAILDRSGMESVTITGGGDPLCYPYFDDMIDAFKCRAISMGLVTNGILLPTISPKTLNRIKWCRISHGDDRLFPFDYRWKLTSIMEKADKVDWAFSYVVSPKPNFPQILELIYLADAIGCTHVRLVADLLCPQDVPMANLKERLLPHLKDITMPVIFQERNVPEHGGNCRICYLKPVVTPDLKVYACCGAQYALDPPSKSFPKELCLGTVDEFPQIIKEHSSEPFKGGELCSCCYYGAYNRALEMLLSKVQHKEFV